MLVYPDLHTFRRIYGQFTKTQLDDNGVVLLIPYYETTDSVRHVLSQLSIDVRKCEQNRSLVIVDSVKAYFHSDIGMKLLPKMMAKGSKRMGKKGVSIIGDMGSFFLYEKQNRMMEYEMELRLDGKENDASSVKIKGICSYHKDTFNTLAKKEQQALFEHHHAKLVVYN
ncbi:MAG: MEDS domain-containing protein [Nitrososphaeraceae archaeon]|nr:MEDS domain-containing protein [Nitrososphaeraceae archaeon]